MKIESTSSALATTTPYKSGKNMPLETPPAGNAYPEKSLIRELAESFDPNNMSYEESMALANSLMKSGEGALSTAFLPPPLLKVNKDGSVVNQTGTPEAESKMNEKFNMFEVLAARIDFNKSVNAPTELLEEAYSLLEKIQLARKTPDVNEYA